MDWGYSACESKVCHYHQGGDLQTHTLKTEANFGRTSNSRVAVRKETNIFISICKHIFFPLSPLMLLLQFCFQGTGKASCPIMWKRFSELFKFSDSTLKYFSVKIENCCRLLWALSLCTGHRNDIYASERSLMFLDDLNTISSLKPLLSWCCQIFLLKILLYLDVFSTNVVPLLGKLQGVCYIKQSTDSKHMSFK